MPVTVAIPDGVLLQVDPVEDWLVGRLAALSQLEQVIPGVARQLLVLLQR